MPEDIHYQPNFLAGIVVALRLGVPVYAGAPGVLNDGDVWIDSSAPSLNFRSGGATSSLGPSTTQEQIEDFAAALIQDNADLDWTYTDNGGAAGALVAVIKNDAVTYAKMQNVSAAARVLGRASGAGAGDVTELGQADLLTILGALDAATLGGDSKATIIAAAVAAVVDTAPGTLDTLNELAAALGDDPNFAATIAAALAIRGRAVDMPVPNGAATGNVDHNLALAQQGGFIARVYVAATGATEEYLLTGTTVNRIVVADETGNNIAAGRRIHIVAL